MTAQSQTAEWFEDDEKLVAELRYATADEAIVPERFREAAKAIFDLRTIDDELEVLTLTYDSVMDDVALVRDAGSARFRKMIFEVDDTGIEIEISNQQIVGQVWTNDPATITVIPYVGQSMQVQADEFGCFTFGRPTGAPLRLRVAFREQRILQTDWFAL